jgi:hypothetical protein
MSPVLLQRKLLYYSSKNVNMKTNNLFIPVLIVSLSVFASCKKNTGSSGFKYKLTTTNRSNAVGRIDAGNITWTSGYATANMLKFEAKNSAGTEVEFKSTVAQHVDVFTSLASSIGNIDLPQGTYSEIEFKAELAPGGSNAALELTGTFTSGASTIPVVFTVNSSLEIKTEKNNVVISDNASYTALTTLNLSQLTSGITEAMLNSATKTNGKIIISAGSNNGIYNAMLSNLDGCDEVEFEHD